MRVAPPTNTGAVHETVACASPPTTDTPVGAGINGHVPHTGFAAVQAGVEVEKLVGAVPIADTHHVDRSALNTVALANIVVMLVTLPVFHVPID